MPAANAPLDQLSIRATSDLRSDVAELTLDLRSAMDFVDGAIVLHCRQRVETATFAAPVTRRADIEATIQYVLQPSSESVLQAKQPIDALTLRPPLTT